MWAGSCNTLLSDRSVRFYLISQMVSLTGSWMQSVAQGWLVYRLTGSTIWLALVAVALTMPVLLLSVAGGAVADRVDRRKLLITTQFISVLPALILGLLTENGKVTAGWVVAMAAVLGTLNAVELPARQALWGGMARAEKLMGALSLNAVVFNLTRIIGPLMAGLVIASWGSDACFYLNAASYLLGGVVLMLAPSSCTQVLQNDRHGLFGDLREGFRYVAERGELARLLVLVAAFSLFGISFVSLLPVFADGVLHVGPKGLGMLAAASGVGSLAAALMLAAKGELRQKGRLVVLAGLSVGLGLFLLARSEAYHESIIALLIVGAGIVSLLALINCLLQNSCPDRLRGRIMGLYTLSLIGMAPFGHALMGLLAGVIGVAGAILVGSSLCLAAVVLTARPISRLA